MIKHLTYLSLAAASILMLPTASASRQKSRADIDIMNWMPKASSDRAKHSPGNPKTLAGPKQKKASIAREAEIKLNALPSADATGICDSPDMTTWFYTMNYDKETIQHEYYTETKINGYTVTLYNEKLEKLGSFSDTMTLEGNETGVVRVEVGPQITRKFFNLDDRYEVMMALSVNTTEYVNHYYTKVYQLDNNTPINTIPGIYVSAINTATDPWSEKFWITFNAEEPTTTPMVGNVENVADYVFKTYRFAGYGGLEEPVLVNRMPTICAAGEDAVPFLADKKNGCPYFAFNYLKYCWYLEPYDWEVEDPTPDNELIVDIYTTPSAWGASVEKYSTTTFPLNATLADRYFLMLGTFSYNNDLALEGYGDSPALIVTKATWTNAADEYVYDYDVYRAAAQGTEAEGEHLVTIARNTGGGIFMADVKGFDPQVLFIDFNDGEEPMFNFVNTITGVTEHSLPYRIGDGLFLTAETERIAGGKDGYLYVVPQTQGMTDDDGNTYSFVAYLNPDGKIDHIDTLNFGKDVDYAQIYSGWDGYNPFIFNLDVRREYMALVKRRNPSGTGNYEELMVVTDDPEAAPLLTAGPDEKMGMLSGITFANLGTENASLVVIYYNGNEFTTVDYPLPLSLFEEGDGSVENPYVITSAGGLDQMRRFPSAHFKIGNDIDAAGYDVSPVNYDFTGSLDGGGHIISNLTVEGRALIPSMVRASLTDIDPDVCAIRNINFVNPKFNATTYNQGFLVGNMTGGIVENVHVYGGRFTSTDDMGGLVGMAVLSSRIEGCSVNADINAPESSVGGIALHTRTGSSINACAFKGTITGGSEVGGILGTADNAADRITNCHVDANITAQNTVGGVIGYSTRAYVANCYVEGAIAATTPSRWGGGVKCGGLIGGMEAWFPSEEQPDQPEEAIVEDNIVALSSLTGAKDESVEKYPGQNDTVHRIIGYSQANSTPDEDDYDSTTGTVIYGDPREPEKALADNYAVATLPLGSDTVEAGANTVEGGSIALAEITRSWLESLGFAYGDDFENPWSYTGVTTLWYEGGLLVFTPASATVVEGSECTLSLALVGGDLSEDMYDSFTCNISDESVLEMSEMTVDNNSILLTFKGLKPGSVTVNAGIIGKTAEANVTVNEFNGVDNVKAPANTLTYDGNTARAEGCAINVFATNGTLTLSGRDVLDLQPLSHGIYIVTATDATGARSSIKVKR